MLTAEGKLTENKEKQAHSHQHFSVPLYPSTKVQWGWAFLTAEEEREEQKHWEQRGREGEEGRERLRKERQRGEREASKLETDLHCSQYASDVSQTVPLYP